MSGPLLVLCLLLTAGCFLAWLLRPEQGADQ